MCRPLCSDLSALERQERGPKSTSNDGLKWRDERPAPMATRFCSHCGSPVVPTATFCASCGAPVGGTAPPPGPPGTPPPVTFAVPSPYTPYPAYPSAYPMAAAPSFGEVDRVALSSVSLAAILGLVGAVLGFLTLLVAPVSSIVSTSTSGSGTSVSLNLSGLYLLVVVAGIGLVLTILELWFYRQAFRALAPGDRRFATPATLVLVALVALVIVILAAIGLVDLVYQAILCSGSGNPITSTCINVGNILGLAAVVGIGAIILLVGFIGLLIGIWRLGTRYGEGMFKVGAILLIFPVLNFVGLILILLAARSARGKFEGTAMPLPLG